MYSQILLDLLSLLWYTPRTPHLVLCFFRLLFGGIGLLTCLWGTLTVWRSHGHIFGMPVGIFLMPPSWSNSEIRTITAFLTCYQGHLLALCLLRRSVDFAWTRMLTLTPGFSMVKISSSFYTVLFVRILFHVPHVKSPPLSQGSSNYIQYA